MTLDQIEQMVRAANPVPDVTALDSPDVGTSPISNPHPGSRHLVSPRAVAVAAVTAAMILVATAVLLADRGEHTTGIEPANPSPSTTASTVSTTTTPFLGSAWLPPQEAPSLPITGELVAGSTSGTGASTASTPTVA